MIPRSESWCEDATAGANSGNHSDQAVYVRSCRAGKVHTRAINQMKRGLVLEQSCRPAACSSTFQRAFPVNVPTESRKPTMAASRRAACHATLSLLSTRSELEHQLQILQHCSCGQHAHATKAIRQYYMEVGRAPSCQVQGQAKEAQSQPRSAICGASVNLP